MASAFKDSLDIANRACQHCGVRRILDVTESTKQNTEISAVYDQLRQSELRRNVWKFSKRRSVLRPIQATTRLLSPQQVNSAVTYLPGSIVSDANGDIWWSFVDRNLGNEPGQTAQWERYYGPMTADLYDSTKAYYAGELVYKAGPNPGGFIIYMSLTNNNEDTPDTADAWDEDVQYGLGDRVSYDGSQWHSLITFNIGTTPAEPPADWDENVTYTTSDPVIASDGYKYTSIGAGNVGNDPIDDDGTNWAATGVPAAWSAVDPEVQEADGSWSPIFSNMTNLSIDWLQAQLGPTYYTSSSQVFRLPAGYLRSARLAPKIRQSMNDYEIIGDYFSSMEGVILFPFVADISDVTKMDPMFCEELAARIGLEVCETLTQDKSKKQDIAAEYVKWGNEARIINGIDLGPEEPLEDEFIVVRR